MPQKSMNLGIIGCGQISQVYLQAQRIFSNIKIVACADINMERAFIQAERHNIPMACSVEDLLANSEIELVINLTNHNAHADVGLKVLQSGKSLYNEKPLAVNCQQGCSLLEMAQLKGLRVGCAPDTFLGGGLQTCRKIIDDGIIGEPIAANAFMVLYSPENWHPNPEIFYQPGDGPMFDMGEYYLTALICLLGPVLRVTGSAKTTLSNRIITNGPKSGNTFVVNTPTHIVGMLEFANGATGTITTSFDICQHRMPYIEIYGTEGTLTLPDPNEFYGPVYVRRKDDKIWHQIPLTHGYTERNYRGIGIADMVYAMNACKPHRASGKLAYHVLDIMQAIIASSIEGQHITLTSTCDRPAPLPVGKSLEAAWDS